MRKLGRPKVFDSFLNKRIIHVSASKLATILNYVVLLEEHLAECYKYSGADPDGDEDWRLAPLAVEEVKRLREESDLQLEFYCRMYDGVKTLIQDELDDLFDKETSEKWWSLPNVSFDRKTPRYMLNSGNGVEVFKELRDFSR